ncbi:MAG: hypothetical protein BroJett011_42080 [Chloroflexota bacterium]|nr:MAG: hypothetical protein BroJett011_42080 [Chloroflexota bacterium]
MVTLKRAIQATIFVVLHAALAVLVMSQVAPSWVVGCGILAAAFATVLLFFFAGDEQSAKLFFFENWREVEEKGGPNVGLVFGVIAAIWLVPVLCFFLALLVVGLIRLGWL